MLNSSPNCRFTRPTARQRQGRLPENSSSPSPKAIPTTPTISSTNPKWEIVETTLLRRRPGLAEASLTQYELAARTLVSFDCKRLTQRDLDRIRDAILAKYRRNSVRTMLTCVRAILRHVYRRRITGRPELLAPGVLLLAVPRYRKRTDPVFSVAQAAAMEKIVFKRKSALVRAVYLLIYDGTLRIGEVANLNVDDIDTEARQLLVRDGKGGDRPVMITREAAEAVDEWLEERPEFRDEKGRAAFITDRLNQYSRSHAMRRIDRKFMTWHLRNIAERAHAPRRATPHLMRATGATHMLNYRGNPEMVRRNMGHRNIETTMLYNRLPAEEERINYDATWEGIRKRAATESTEDILRSAALAFHRKEIGSDTLERIMKNLRRAEESRKFEGPVRRKRPGAKSRVTAAPDGKETLDA